MNSIMSYVPSFRVGTLCWLSGRSSLLIAVHKTRTDRRKAKPSLLVANPRIKRGQIVIRANIPFATSAHYDHEFCLQFAPKLIQLQQRKRTDLAKKTNIAQEADSPSLITS